MTDHIVKALRDYFAHQYRLAEIKRLARIRQAVRQVC